MLCDNCKKREANVRYSENINGVRKEMNLCEECSRKLGIADKMNFDMNMNFPSLDFSRLFGGIFEDFSGFSEPDFMPLLNEIKDVKCKTCGLSFDDIVSNGRLGCPDCYETKKNRLDPILKRMQSSNRHVGRLGKIHENAINTDQNSNENKEVSKEQDKLTKLENDLKQEMK